MEKICNGCGNENQHQEEMTMVSMSSADWQRNEQRHEKREKRHWILEIILAALIVFSNLGWLIYESQFETVTYQQDGEGINNVNYGEQGDLNNGAESENQAQEEQ